MPCAKPHKHPLLLVDVDGVISLFGFDHADPPDGTWTLVDGLPHLLSNRAAKHLARLARAFECVWCTGWEDRTGRLGELLGLDLDWPYVRLDGLEADSDHWKLPGIDAHVPADRPLAWVDDRFDASCERWAAARSAPTLLVPTDPAVGLTGEHVEALEAWAAGLPGW